MTPTMLDSGTSSIAEILIDKAADNRRATASLRELDAIRRQRSGGAAYKDATIERYLRNLEKRGLIQRDQAAEKPNSKRRCYIVEVKATYPVLFRAPRPTGFAWHLYSAIIAIAAAIGISSSAQANVMSEASAGPACMLRKIRSWLRRPFARRAGA